MGKFIDMKGQKFNHWTVISQYGKDKNGNSLWLCECDCNDKTQKIVSGTSLRFGKSKCCGCTRGEKLKTHGKSSKKNTSELDKKIYKTWESMKQRCFNKNRKEYKNYGGRGVRVCEEWISDFINFYNWSIENGVDLDLSIDRIDVNGNYEPDNCRWITFREQQNNKRYNHLLTFEGESKTIAEWERELGYKKGVLRMEIHRGKTLDEIMNKRGEKYESRR